MRFAIATFALLLGTTACHFGWHDDDWDDDWDVPRPAPVAPAPDCPDVSCPSGTDATYLSGDARACAVIQFDCPEGSSPFHSPCGCGCEVDAAPEPDPATCPDELEGAVYLSREAKVCEGVDFTCPDGQERFDSDCGCGCWDTCPARDDPRAHYLSEDPLLCDAISFECPDACMPFDNRCGCGCIEPEVPVGACPDPDDPDVRYVSTDPSVCERITLSCPPDCEVFNDACGCGCIE